MDENFPNKPVNVNKEEPSSEEIASSISPDEIKKISLDSSASNSNITDKENFSDPPLINKEPAKKNDEPPVESTSTDDSHRWLDKFSASNSNKKDKGNFSDISFNNKEGIINTEESSIEAISTDDEDLSEDLELKLKRNKICDDSPARLSQTSNLRHVGNNNADNVPSTSICVRCHPLKLKVLSVYTDLFDNIRWDDSNFPKCSCSLPQQSTMSYQLEHLLVWIVPELQRLCYLGTDSRPENSELDNSTLDEIYETLRTGRYKTARQCIADIDKVILAVYMAKELDVSSQQCTLQTIRRVEEQFHQKIIDLDWKASAPWGNDSPYYPISVLTEPGRLTNQLKYLRDKVFKYLRNHEYSFLLQRESPVLPAGGSSDEAVGEGEMMTLEIIEERLKNNKYYTAKQCVEDIDALFMDCYVHKTVDNTLLQILASIQIGLHDKIAEMMEEEKEITKEDFEYYTGEEDKNARQLLYLKNVVAPELSKHEYADPFKTSEEFKQYLSILYDEEDIEEPVSLSKIKKRLQENKYVTPMECIQDYDLMFDKVLQTGLTEHLLYVQAEGLKKLFEKKIQSILNSE